MFGPGEFSIFRFLLNKKITFHLFSDPHSSAVTLIFHCCWKEFIIQSVSVCACLFQVCLQSVFSVVAVGAIGAILDMKSESWLLKGVLLACIMAVINLTSRCNKHCLYSFIFHIDLKCPVATIFTIFTTDAFALDMMWLIVCLKWLNTNCSYNIFTNILFTKTMHTIVIV